MLFQWYKRLRFSRSPLVDTLYQDGIVFYLCLFSRSACWWRRWFIHVSTAISLINLLVQILGPVRPILYFWYCRRVDCYISIHSGGNSVDICHVRFTSCLLVSRLHAYSLYDTFFCRPQRVMHSILSCRILLHVRMTDRAMRDASDVNYASF